MLWPGASPVNRLAVAANEERLEALSRRLTDFSRPIAPRGVALTLRLLTDPMGPLYDRRRAGELRTEVTRALAGLDELPRA